ncbi:NACHT domain-containing protein, partial [Streptomyces sp. NPDC001652]|uniref:NACHT domain-containing protein n=1 Tax=Streptomyces sp. NPDC001652 TaxID=3154393 RepID=UPI00332C0671
MGIHREALYRRLRKLRTDAEASRRRQGTAGGLQKALEKQVRLTGLPETSSFEGKVASRWAPARLEDFSVPRPESEQVLAVVAVWESWAGARTLQDDGRIRPAWLAGEGCKEWRRVLKAAHEETMRARRRIPDASGKEAEVDAAVVKYRGRLVQSYGRLNLDVLGPDGRAGEQPAIRLRQVFEVPLASWDPPRPELPARVWRELVERGEVQEDDLPESDLPATPDARQAVLRRAAQAEQPPLPVLEAVASQRGRRLVLLGDPGAGKSTLARFLALALADGLERVPDALQDLAAAGAVPVVVELRHLADDERWRGRTVEDFWEEFNATERMCLPRGVLQYLLEHTHRPVVMIFDGLDEIFAPARRAEVARQVAAFAQAYEHVRVILTSRGIGFHAGVFTNAGFSQAKLDDLSHQQIETFIHRWYHAAHPDDPSEASRLTERLINAVRGFPSVAELAGNPLLLTILASIGLGATIPRERREVYRHAVDVLTGRWDRDAKHLELPRQDHPDVAAAIEELDGRLLQELLERIARRLQEGAGDGQTGTLISRAELSGLISDYVIEMGYPAHVARIVANAMVDRLHERAFLLHPHGAGMYGFVHRTFLEYLAARDLSERYTAGDPSLRPLVDVLAERSADPAWHEVILLLLGQISRQAEAEHAAFIHRLLAMHQQGSTDYVQLNGDSKYLELAIRALAEAHRIGRTPSRPVQHPHQSLALQSNAAIDALITHLANTFFPNLNNALPAIASFPYSWTGRERFHRWYKAELARPARWIMAGKVAMWMCRNLPEAIQLARIPWARDTDVTLRVLEERWPDREETRATALDIARDTTTPDNVRSAALRTLGERWPDHEDSRTTILNAARDTTTPDNARTAALRTLATGWPDHEDSRTTILNAARDTTTPDDARSAALDMLATGWPDHEDSRTTLLNAARDTTTPDNVRTAALHTLGERWPDREDSRTTILNAARDTTTPDNVRSTALHTLGERWPDHEETRTTLLNIAQDTTTPDNVRTAALRTLGERWLDHEDSRTTLLNIAQDTTTPDNVRTAALRTLGERWLDHE